MITKSELLSTRKIHYFTSILLVDFSLFMFHYFDMTYSFKSILLNLIVTKRCQVHNLTYY